MPTKIKALLHIGETMFEWLKNIFSHEKHEAKNDANREIMDEEHIREKKKDNSPLDSPPKDQNK